MLITDTVPSMLLGIASCPHTPRRQLNLPRAALAEANITARTPEPNNTITTMATSFPRHTCTSHGDTPSTTVVETIPYTTSLMPDGLDPVYRGLTLAVVGALFGTGRRAMSMMNP